MAHPDLATIDAALKKAGFNLTRMNADKRRALYAKHLPKTKLPNKVNHPAHYGGDTVYETIKVIDAWDLDFYLGNAVKYISRAGKKDPAKAVEDLQKAQWYLAGKIAKLEARKG